MPNSDTKQKTINPKCMCPKISCRRHGDCKACKKHHSSNLPFCKIDFANLEEMNRGFFHGRFHRRRHKLQALKQLLDFGK